MTVWWSRRGAIYKPPETLTDLDLEWLTPHLRLAGMNDGAPPPGTGIAATMFMAEYYDPSLVGDGDGLGAMWRRRRR